MMDRFRLTYLDDDSMAIYHVRGGKVIGLPIATIRQGMYQSARYLVDCANAKPKKSIWTRNNRPGDQK